MSDVFFNAYTTYYRNYINLMDDFSKQYENGLKLHDSKLAYLKENDFKHNIESYNLQCGTEVESLIRQQVLELEKLTNKEKNY